MVWQECALSISTSQTLSVQAVQRVANTLVSGMWKLSKSSWKWYLMKLRNKTRKKILVCWFCIQSQWIDVVDLYSLYLLFKILCFVISLASVIMYTLPNMFIVHLIVCHFPRVLSSCSIWIIHLCRGWQFTCNDVYIRNLTLMKLFPTEVKNKRCHISFLFPAQGPVS